VLAPAWPDGCTAEGLTLHCGKAGLTGTLTMEGVGRQYSAALVKVFWIDGQTSVYTLTAGQPSVQLFGSAQDKRGMGEIARAYTLLGVEHILAGIDHLMFVIGLLFLVGFRRQLLWTITAFTAAHSLTLACAALGLLTLRSPPQRHRAQRRPMLPVPAPRHRPPTWPRVRGRSRSRPRPRMRRSPKPPI